MSGSPEPAGKSAALRALFRGRCVACERPAAPHARVCVYCGETLVHALPARLARSITAALVFAGAAAFMLVRGPAMHGAMWARLAADPPACMLFALGIGLALLPPRIRGVSAVSRRERWWQVAPVASGSLALAVVTAACALSAASPQPWTLAAAVLAAVTAAALAAAPIALGLPWHPLAAGAFLGAALACIR